MQLSEGVFRNMRSGSGRGTPGWNPSFLPCLQLVPGFDSAFHARLTCCLQFLFSSAHSFESTLSQRLSSSGASEINASVVGFSNSHLWFNICFFHMPPYSQPHPACPSLPQCWHLAGQGWIYSWKHSAHLLSDIENDSRVLALPHQWNINLHNMR